MERNRRYRRDSYIMGNTARQVAPAIQDRPQVRNQKVAERKRMKSTLAINGVSVVIMATVAFIFIALCVGYLYLQSNISETRASITKIKAENSAIQSQNDAMQYDINSFDDSENVYKIATEKLGMKQAKADQIIVYKSTDKGYTVQYGEIPNK